MSPNSELDAPEGRSMCACILAAVSVGKEITIKKTQSLNWLVGAAKEGRER